MELLPSFVIKKKKSISLSCNVLIWPYSSFSGYGRQKKVNTFLQCYFSHSLWYMDPCQECNQQEVEETAALASSCSFAVSANSLHGSSSSNGFPVVILCVSWKICWRTRMSEVFSCSWSTDLLYALLLSSMSSNYNKVDVSYSFTKFKMDKFKHSLKVWKWKKKHKYTNISMEVGDIKDTPPFSFLTRQVSSLCPCPPFLTNSFNFHSWFMTGNTSTHPTSVQWMVSNLSIFSKA